jgi:hypothetical protein
MKQCHRAEQLEQKAHDATPEYRLEEAVGCLREALAIREAHRGKPHPDLIWLNKMLTIFAPYTFSHNQGQPRSSRDLPGTSKFWSSYLKITGMQASGLDTGR